MSYIEENAAERKHLIDLANRLTDAQLRRQMDAGWTVSAILAHLAFWDQRAVVLLDKWQQSGVGPSPIDTDIVNEAMRVHCLAIPPRAAVELAILCAIAIDQKIEQLDSRFLTNVATTGKTVHLNRAEHRREHLGRIERILTSRG
jgi:hypothetical protein